MNTTDVNNNHNVSSIMRQNYLEYASYVILDRAIPDALDGLKPVQRRILFALLKMHDGRLHKVMNVVGQTMPYHPHGEASINEALVTLANKNYLLDRQGNFGNMHTGDAASAGRYIETRLSPMALDILYKESLTEFVPTYDGRANEPVRFPVKIPLLLLHGTEGIAVGMATKVLTHNFCEVIRAQIAFLKNKSFTLYPDFFSAGMMDVTDYNKGNGKVRVRARMEVLNDKVIKIFELPYGVTADSLINSVEEAAKKGKIKVDSIQDYTAENVHIEIKLPRGQYSNDYVDRLYALTNCEVTLHANAVVILDNKPQQLNVNQIVEYHTTYFKQTVEQDLNNEKACCLKKIFYKTLEQIFIENKVYRELETLKDNSKMHQVVYDGVIKFLDKSFPNPNEDDIKHLCELPIRRISRYDREKNDIDIQQLRDELAVIEDKLTHLTQTTIDILNDILKKYGKQYPRCTEISEFDKVQARVLDQRKIKVGVNLKDGFVGKKVNGPDVLDAYFHDKIVLFYNDGSYLVTNPEDKVYVHTKTKKVICVDVYRAENEYSIAYRSANDRIYANRFKIPGFIANKPYPFIPKGSSLLAHTPDQNTTLIVDYVVFPRMKIPQEKVEMINIPLRSPSTKGIQISKKEVKKVRFKTYKRNHAANTE